MRYADAVARLAILGGTAGRGGAAGAGAPAGSGGTADPGRPLPPGLAILDPVALVAPADDRDGARTVTRRVTTALPVRDAAALVLIHPDAAGDAVVVLTRRHDGTHRHAGQVSFPGGRRDPGDDFPTGTALREAAEEVGLDLARDPVRIMGTLDPIDVRVSGFLLVPVVAVAERTPALRADPHEVERIIHAPLDAIVPGAPVEVVEEERDGWWLRYGAFPIDGERVWGATARALGQLGAILGG